MHQRPPLSWETPGKRLNFLLLLPEPLGLNSKYSNRTAATQLMTVGLYVTGALVATAVTKLLNKKKQVRHKEWERKLVTSAMG